MASGDTKTEAMLNVLGNGGSGDEFRGCCNTKTQQYILDAIDRINRIQPGGSYDAGTGIEIADNTISVDTDTIQPKLTAGTGIDITDNTISATGGGGDITVVQTTGNSTTDVMSQDATTKMVYKDNNTKHIAIGSGATTSATAGNSYTAIGSNASATGAGSVAIQGSSTAVSSVAIGDGATAEAMSSVALGAGSRASTKGVIDTSTSLISSTAGYNDTQYRLLSGLYDPQTAHDAATKGYVDAQAGYNILPLAQDAIENPEVPQTITTAQYLEIEAACMAGRPLYAGESRSGYRSYYPNINYECYQGSAINIDAENNPAIGGVFNLVYNGGNPTIVFTPA